MRRTLRGSLVTLTLSVALLAGCGGGSDESSDAGGAASPPAGQKIELNFWSWAPNMDKTVEVWNQSHPDIHVTVNKQDGGDPAVTKLLTAVKAGSGAPDLMQAEYQAIPTMVAAGALADIKDEVDPALKDKFAEGVWNSVTLGSDALYAIPQDSGPMVFYYRDDVFTKYGLTVPTTWDEYAETARALRAKDPKAYLGTFSATDPGWFVGLTQQNGASWWGIDGDSWTVSIDSDQTRKVAYFWGGLVEEGVIANTPMYTPDWNAALNNGTQVGWLSAVWGPGVLAGNAADTQGKWKVAPLPQWDASAPATGNWGGSGTAVTEQSDNKAAAAQFAAWINTDPAGVKALATVSNVYPADQAEGKEALSTAPEFFSNQPDFYDVVAGVAGGAGNFTYGPNTNVAYSAYNDAFGKAAQAKSKAAFVDALAQMQSLTLKNLQDSGYATK